MPEQTFEAVVGKILNANQGTRVLKFEHQGQFYWLKQAEKLTGAMRFLKQSPAKALQVEVETLTMLASKGAQVPRLMCSSSDHFVIADVGPTISSWLSDKTLSQDEKQQILNASATALANLHKLGLAHGRPALRDISWSDGQVHFIDFEASQNSKAIAYQQRRDLLVYIHSLYRYMGADHEMITPAIQAYRDAGGDAIWLDAKHWLASWQWIYPGLRLFKDIGGKDLRPMYWLLWHFRQIA